MEIFSEKWKGDIKVKLALRERLLVAKAEKAGERWLPLYIHLSDTAGVMDKLLSEYLADSFSDMCELSRDELKKTALFPPRQIQSDVLKIISSVKESGIYIVEAPMGCGKTEIALAAAEILAAKFERTGLFFGLPTQATSNGIFPRVLEWAKKQSDEMFQSIQLAHGSAMLNNTFMDIERGIPEVYDGDMDGEIVVHSWFCGKKQSCLADFVVLGK